MKHLITTLLIVSLTLQPLGLIPPVLAETINMKYTDPNHLHAPKEVNGVTYQYDNNGNLTNDGERTIIWDQDNLPVKITKDNTEVKFSYDANGRRVAKEVKNTTSGETIQKTIYVNQYYQLSRSGDGRPPAETKYYFANGRIAQRNGDNLVFLHQDHLGSTVLATDTNSQKVIDSLTYFPYGNTPNSQLPVTSYLFTGQELDPESDLYNYNARLYNPKTGVFISADTVGGGNRYSYAENNPMMFTDPTGHAVDAGDGGGGGYECTAFHPCLSAIPKGVKSTPVSLFEEDKFFGGDPTYWQPEEFIKELRRQSEGQYDPLFYVNIGQERIAGPSMFELQMASSYGMVQQSILDIGIGGGGPYLNAPGKKYVGLDSLEAYWTKDGFVKLGQTYPGTEPVIGTAKNIPFKAESFDEIIMNFPLGSLKDEGLLGRIDIDDIAGAGPGWYEEFARVLKSEGTLTIRRSGLNEQNIATIIEKSSGYFEVVDQGYMTVGQLRAIGTQSAMGRVLRYVESGESFMPRVYEMILRRK